MLNNWDDPFAQFSNNNNAASDIGNTIEDVIKAEAIEAETKKTAAKEAEAKATPKVNTELTAEAARADAATVSAAKAANKAPHAGDGIVSNEQLMATAGAAPQVLSLIHISEPTRPILVSRMPSSA